MTGARFAGVEVVEMPMTPHGADPTAPLVIVRGEGPYIWDAKGKVFRDKPLHSWHSHHADAVRTLATAYKAPKPRDGRPPEKSKIHFDVFARPSSW